LAQIEMYRTVRFTGIFRSKFIKRAREMRQSFPHRRRDTLMNGMSEIIRHLTQCLNRCLFRTVEQLHDRMAHGVPAKSHGLAALDKMPSHHFGDAIVAVLAHRHRQPEFVLCDLPFIEGGLR
jgi:hypothetical protein